MTWWGAAAVNTPNPWVDSYNLKFSETHYEFTTKVKNGTYRTDMVYGDCNSTDKGMTYKGKLANSIYGDIGERTYRKILSPFYPLYENKTDEVEFI